jgi:HEAT repeat protein
MADFNFDHAHRVVEALARQGAKYTEKVLELLGQKVTDFESDPMSWMEILLIELAGEMRLERAIPLIVAKLHEEGDYVLEESVNALGRIGTDGAAEAVTEGWLATSWDYRLYATSALEKIHSDTTVQKCLELLPQDKDRNIRTKLADALLAQLAPAGIEPVREMVQKRAYDEHVGRPDQNSGCLRRTPSDRSGLATALYDANVKVAMQTIEIVHAM